MKISVVVPAFNEERLLPAALASIDAALQAFGERGWSSELIVCDNNSTDRTAGIARAAGARVVFEPVNQISRARNTGARYAGGDWLLFVDADSFPSRELFAEVAEAIEAGRCLAGGSTVAFENRDLVVRFWVALWNAMSRIMKWGAGSFVFCEAAAFRAAGGFNEQLYASEEIDLFRRLKRLARRKRRSIVILHRHPLRTSDRKVRLYSWREHGAFLAKTLFTGGRTLRSREACRVWYDGRR
jgi:glycosyltransferase involved in cell wall biosynthesis